MSHRIFLFFSFKDLELYISFCFFLLQRERYPGTNKSTTENTLINSEAVKAKSQFFFFQDSEIIYSNQKTLNEICMKILRRIIKALIQEKDNMYENYEALNTCDSIF